MLPKTMHADDYQVTCAISGIGHLTDGGAGWKVRGSAKWLQFILKENMTEQNGNPRESIQSTTKVNLMVEGITKVSPSSFSGYNKSALFQSIQMRCFSVDQSGGLADWQTDIAVPWAWPKTIRYSEKCSFLRTIYLIENRSNENCQWNIHVINLNK